MPLQRLQKKPRSQKQYFIEGGIDTHGIGAISFSRTDIHARPCLEFVKLIMTSNVMNKTNKSIGPGS